VELETGSCQRRAAIIGERTPDGATVAPYDLGLGIGAFLKATFQGTHAADVLFEGRLGMAVGLVDRLGRFAQVVKVTELVGHLG
jgi:hypothetical protein